MSEQFSGKVEILDSASNVTITLNGNNGRIWLKDSNGNDRVYIDALGRIYFKDPNGTIRAFISHGGNIYLHDSNGNDKVYMSALGRIWLKDSNGKQRAIIGLTGQYLKDSNGTTRAEIRSTSGRIFLRDSNGNLRASMGGDGKIKVWDSSHNQSITIDGGSGDIILRNADAAEHFDIADAVTAEPGMIMTLNEDGKLKPSSIPYDKKVVGVIAGAGDHRPGIIMDHRGDNGKTIPVSVLGKVSCKADATNAPIEAGDLLTTSHTIGHAMKATDSKKAFGSVIGKALSPLSEGVGFVNMLVTLQ